MTPNSNHESLVGVENETDTAAVFSFPASFSQQRLWFLDQLMPGSSVYNIPAAIRMRGALHIGAMEQSLSEIVGRHEALRTTFGVENQQPMQYIKETLNWSLPIIDLQTLPEAECEQEVKRLIAEEAERPFDLQVGPLLRTTLLKLSDEDHVLLITMHHIISDGWSAEVFIKELSALYVSFANGKPSPLPELPFQYADYAHYQREWMQGEVLDEQLAYWNKQLGGNLSVLQLPTDRPRPSEQSYVGASIKFALPKQLTEGLKALSQREGVTLFMTLMTAYKTLLHRYTAQEDILVGSPVANRSLEEVEGLIGFFVNNVVLRTNVEGQMTFHELLKQVRKVALDAYAHQEVPFEKLVEELQPERNMAYSPIFQTMFVLQNSSLSTMQLAGLTLEFMENERKTAKFDVLLDMVEEADGLVGTLEYSTDLFDAPTIERMASHFRVLLEGIVANPALPISQLPILLEDEAHRLLVEWNDTHMEYPKDLCTHQLFEAQVLRTPDNIALIVGEERLTYRELNERANHLAHYLRDLGVGPEVLVGVCMERSVELMVGLLGVFKAGGAYVPLDPAYPSDRIALMLEDAEVPVLLTQERLLDNMPEHQAREVCLDRDWAEIAKQANTNPENITKSENLAYVIYTSGSTGRPKGVAIYHQNTVNFVTWALQSFDAEDLSGMLFSTSVCFDLSVYEMFVPLAMGGKIIMAKDALHLPTLPAREEVTMINTVPSAIAELVRMKGVPQSVRVVNLAGEPLQNALVKQIYNVESIKAVVNLYGPTEDTTYATYATIPADSDLIPTIGKPLANNQVYLLDQHLKPVPQGVAGELYIGGDSLARGYLKQPEMTAERFLPNPFRTEPGARIYKTGDLARYRPDGNIEYLGRLDHQVKIRGFRIELGEIESVLSKHPSVHQVVVVARKSGLGDMRLVAYLGVDSEARPTVSDLRGHLRGRLPAYMMPSIFVVLDALPLTPNGKIDRKALPEPDQSLLDSDTQYVAPRNPIEETVAGIFADLLERKQVGVEDNFFEIGGHSLLATQLMARIRDTFGVDLPLRQLFESPNVEGLSSRIEQSRTGSEGHQPIEKLVRDGSELPLSSAQKRLWLIDQLEEGTAAYNIYAAVRMNGDLNKEALHASLNAIVARHESLRTTFDKVDGRQVQVIAEQLAIPLPVTDLTHLPQEEREAEVNRLAIADATTPYSLNEGPLVRVTLLHLGAEEHVLLLNMHHIVSDGWSIGVFVNELAMMYTGFVNEEPAELPELPIQYADYANWQNQYFQGDAMDKMLGYWTKQLGGQLPVLELPTSRQRPPVQTFNGAKHKVAFSKALTDQLKSFSQREGVTLFMTLMTGFSTLLRRYTGQEDIIIGSPIANRTRSETEGLIGFFVNTLAMRVNLANEPSFRDLLQRVRDVSLDAYEHQDMPFEKLVEVLQPERDMSRTPIFQVVFNLINSPMPDLVLPGMNITLMDVESNESKFDLTLQFTETVDGLQGWIEYNTDLFDADVIERMAGHYSLLIENGIAQPEQSVEKLLMLTQAELQQMLYDWNSDTVEFPQDKLMHQYFEEHAERQPDATAIIFEEQRVTYRELNERANRLAHYLRDFGVGPDDLVGMSMERGIEMIVAMQAILKAGGGYVPIDPVYPKDRIAMMLEDAEVKVLLTQERLLEGMQEVDTTVVCIDRDWPVIEKMPSHNPEIITKPEHIGYVIYTSGSTGKPKSSLIPHRNAVSLFHALDSILGNTPDDVLLSVTSISFDVSIAEMFYTMARGSAILMLSSEGVTGTPGTTLGGPKTYTMLEEAQRHNATILQCAPALMKMQLINPGAPEALKSLRAIMLGGEPVPIALAAQIHEQLPNAKLINGYGPSECTIYSTWHHIVENEGQVPIGRPVKNLKAYVLDQHMQPVPIGVIGELFMGGVAVSRGYLKRPELTKERFLPNPFVTETVDNRMYKTGDLVRFRNDGVLEYLGRTDFQVKVRGYRIELGEIEALLSKYPGVDQVVVIAHDSAYGDKRLVGYLGVSAGELPTSNDLKAYLRDRLPAYMVPSVFVVLEKLPISPNGKIDRKALPEPSQAQLNGDTEYVAPRTPTEETLAGIYADLLERREIGASDNFFEIGGHSLLATQLMARIRTAFGVELPLRALFEAPTVEELASLIEEERNTDVQTLPLAPVSRDIDLPLSFVQQRLWFLDQLMPGNSAYNIYQAVRLEGTLNIEALEDSLTEMVERHETLRTSFVSVDGRQKQVIAPPSRVTLPIIDLSGLPEAEREAESQRLQVEESQKPFRLEDGSLARVTLHRLSETEHVMLVTMHHIISDGWSIAVFVQEFGALYAGKVTAQEAHLPKLDIQFADYAHWQNEWLQGDVMQNLLGYWKKQLGGTLPVLELPTDRPRPAVPTYHGAKQTLMLSETLTENLKALCQREGVTLFMVLLAGYTSLLQRYSGQDDIIVGSPIANRTHAETQALIGCFINALAMRVNLEGNPTFRDLLQRVREMALDAYAHQDMPFEKLVEELQPERSLNRNPIYDVMLNVMNQPHTAVELPGLNLNYLEVEEQESKFTMTLYAEEQNGRLNLRLVYQNELFTEERMAVFLDQFQYLLEQITEAPDRTLDSYSLVTPVLADRLPNPAHEIPEPTYALVPDQFTEAANRLPNQAAITKGGRNLSYSDLLANSRTLASKLVALGIERGDAVAVCGERDFGLYAAMMGVLMSGGVLITLDRNLPAQRQQLMLETAQAKGLLVIGERREEDAWMADLPTLKALVAIDPATGLPTGEEVINLEAGSLPVLNPDDAAYIFFTSGTTGVPKGVLGRHRGLAHFVTWQREEFAINEQDRMAQLTGLSFDVVMRDIFTTLTSGATLCLPDDGTDLAPDQLMTWLEREGITLMHTVPARTQSWLASTIPSEITLHTMRTVFFAGEPLTDTLVKKWRDTFPQAGEIVNLYGPTETTLAKCFYRVPEGNLSAVQPVGTPLPQTQVLIMGQTGQLCGYSEPGEIVIRTPFRSLGYINQETGNSKFVKNPFRNDDNDLLYYTGDLGVYRPDGVIEILGRADDQVKIRGMRVELGEILAMITQQPSVREGVVVVKQDEQGEKRLVAYVVFDQDGEVTTSELRTFLKQRLPGHMIPSVFITLDSLPLTANGKVDRRKLPEPTSFVTESAEEYVAPSNELEGQIAQAWCEVLNLEQVGVNDNFFDLGGHSLLMVQLQTKLREVLERDVPMVELFKYPTVGSLAKHLGEGQEQMSLEENFDRAKDRREALNRQRKMRQGNRRN